ncbi:hypothetical protein [Planomicrobium sp. Y74]|uniref:hypothetical protein n=1 Tax=Planomicrobium sp. Y74 TaxID=2478977 RepID=UPI000EF54CDE|nr:hypothetical protein [Planomicrobium sp. Y74]RLQ84728.1 hypothetical protein D9754_17375 [Planomicrobium sp. Y74]
MAIINKGDFDLIQQLIKSHKCIRSQQNTPLFIGLLLCDISGAGMHFKHYHYVCGHQNKFAKKDFSENFRPIETKLKQTILNNLNNLYFSNVSVKDTEKFLEKKLEKLQTKPNKDYETHQSKLANLRSKKQKALKMLLDDKVD